MPVRDEEEAVAGLSLRDTTSVARRERDELAARPSPRRAPRWRSPGTARARAAAPGASVEIEGGVGGHDRREVGQRISSRTSSDPELVAPSASSDSGRLGAVVTRAAASCRARSAMREARRRSMSTRPGSIFWIRFRIAMALAAKPSAASSSAISRRVGTASRPRPAAMRVSASWRRRRPSRGRVLELRLRQLDRLAELLAGQQIGQSGGLALGQPVENHARAVLRGRLRAG